MATLVQVQTLRGTGGHVASLEAVRTAVAKRNTENPDAQAHQVVEVQAVAPNTKGMQFQLSLLAVVARANDATMIRLSVHNAQVALCGSKESIEATQREFVSVYNEMATLVSTAYVAELHGNRVGFTNGFLCGLVAGMQDGRKIRTGLVYGLGYLHSFPKPGSGDAYDFGYKVAQDAFKAVAEVKAPAKAPRPIRQKEAQAESTAA